MTRIDPLNTFHVNQFNGKIELLGFSQRGLRILRVLGTPDCTASDAAKIVGCSKSLVSHWKNHALEAGAFRLLSDGIVKYYELTPLAARFWRVQKTSLRVRRLLRPAWCMCWRITLSSLRFLQKRILGVSLIGASLVSLVTR